MKRWGSVLFIVLLLVPVMAGNVPQSATAPLLEQQAILSTDGSESSESITSFSTTLASDTLFYPDLFHNDTIDSADTGSASGDDTTGSYTDTFSINGISYGAQSNPSDAYVYLNFTVPSGHIEGVRLAIYGNATIGVYIKNVEIYDFTAETWTDYDDLEDSDAWYNHTTYDPDYWSVDDVVYVRIHLLTVVGAKWGYIDYAEVTWYIMHLADSDHYAESFADVSDWAEYSCEIAATLSSDGDVFSFESESGTDDNWNGHYSDIATFDAQGKYIEIRAKVNSTANYDMSAIRLVNSNDGTGSDFYYQVFYCTTDWQTFKYPADSFTKNGNGDLSAVESILIMHRIDSAAGTEVQNDYLRVGPADEMGWSHSGSTTAGVVLGDSEADWNYNLTSDGDVLKFEVLRDATGAGDNYCDFIILFDTTSTSIDLETDYYQNVAMRYRITAMYSSSATVATRMDTRVGTVMFSTVTKDWTTVRINQLSYPAGGTSYKYIYVYVYGTQVGDSATIEIDWVKADSIANCTVTQSGVTSDDYLYVDSGVLYSNIDDGYIELNHDPALSVSDTYSVWNLTTPGTAPEFSQYVSEWSAYSDETRGATTSGTVTDIKLKFDSTEVLSAIKFIEDGTAPVVVRSSSTPNDPEDDETVTLSAVITDAVEVYAVAFNAIVYPTGFSDVDYDATEQADNLWTYEFSSLITGYYCFKIVASDGANDNALTEYAYIELSVREAAIRVEEITLIGAGSDFEMMTFSARINRDCSFTIYEESASSPESDTHTGSVTAPSFNLAWTKLDVDDANVNFTIRFTSGSLTYNYTSQYQVAQTTFYVSTVTQMVSLDTVTVTGRITKLGAYQVYDDLNVLKDYGTLADLDFKIQFTRWGGYDEQNHDFAIKFTNGTQTCWYNSSFYAFKKPVVAAFQTTDPNVLYAFQVSFWTLIAVVAVGGMVAVDFYRKEVK